MVFRDRIEAARLLAERLSPYRGRNPLVLAIPRGAVPLGRVIADALGGELDVALVRKVGAPGHPEYAVAAVDELGHLHVERAAGRLGVPQEYLEQSAAAAAAELKGQRAVLGREMIAPAGRVVILVDDGATTGATLLTAARCLRDQGPERLVAALPVVNPPALARVAAEVDELVYLEAPEPFYTVSQFYGEYPPVAEAELARYLGPAREMRP